jgi:hypothetical protein
MQMKLLSINCENLFIDLPVGFKKSDLDILDDKRWNQLGRGLERNKKLSHLQGLSKTILELEPDIITLSEVGGKLALEYFNELFLNNSFEVCLIEGNSDRNIHLAALVKKSRDFKYDYKSNKNITLDLRLPHEEQSLADGRRVRKRKLSRDIPELHIFNSNDQLTFVFLLVHLKSKRDQWGLDPGGKDQRLAELNALKELVVKRGDHHKVPVFVTGDFNTRLQEAEREEEFNHLLEDINYKEIFDHLNLAAPDRITFYSRGSRIPALGHQLDSFLFPESAKDIINKEESTVVHYTCDKGERFTPPTCKADILNMYSDHLPILIKLKL